MKQKEIIRKITISAMLIALGIILERVLMVPIGSLNRIAFGSSAVILSSFVVGPLFGAMIGAVVDIFGFIINNPTGLVYTPYVTLGFMALGILPWALNFAMGYIKRFRYYFYISYIFLGVLAGYGLWFIYSRDSYFFNLGGGNTFEVDLTTIFARVILPLLGMVIFFGFVLYVQLLAKKFPRNFTQKILPHDFVYIIYLLLTLLAAYCLWFISFHMTDVFTPGLIAVLAWLILTLIVLLSYVGLLYFVNFIFRKIPRQTILNSSTQDIVFIVLIVEVLITIFWGVQWRLWFAQLPTTLSPVLYFNQVIFFVIGFPVKATIVLLGLRAQQIYKQAGVL